MATTKVQTGIRFEEETLQKLKIIALLQRRSLNNLIEVLAEDFITRYETENGSLPPIEP